MRPSDRARVVKVQDAGFAAIDLGDLATGDAMEQIHHPLAGVKYVCAQEPALASACGICAG